MKLLSICDPTQYDKPPLDVPMFYQQLSRDPWMEFYHIPTPRVFTEQSSAIAFVSFSTQSTTLV